MVRQSGARRSRSLLLFVWQTKVSADVLLSVHRAGTQLVALHHEIDPTFADAHCNLGAVLYNSGAPEAARRCFERCLEIDSRHVEAHFNLANLLEEAGCDEMAMSHYRQALRSDPFYAELHVNMALLYERLSAPGSGREHWRRYLQLDPMGTWSEVARQRLGKPTPEPTI